MKPRHKGQHRCASVATGNQGTADRVALQTLPEYHQAQGSEERLRQSRWTLFHGRASSPHDRQHAMNEKYMKNPEPELHIRQRPSEAVSIQIPLDTLASLKKVAESRDMS
jgi:hypothetical protein